MGSKTLRGYPAPQPCCADVLGENPRRLPVARLIELRTPGIVYFGPAA